MNQTPKTGQVLPIGRRCPSCAGTGRLPNGKLTGFVACEVCGGSGTKVTLLARKEAA